MNKKIFQITFIAAFAASALLLVGCASTSKAGNADYDAFREARPVSILVLPPLNNSVEVNAPGAVQASATAPLSEAGYYVIPVAVTQQMFRQNGIQTAYDAHNISARRLREIFGADAALYLTVTKFGAQYQVIKSVVEAEISASLVDLRTGKELWKGKITHKEEPRSVDSTNPFIKLAGAVVSQVANTLDDSTSFDACRNAMSLMLTAYSPKGPLFGPYNPKYESD